jgi:hypothetical protein
VSVFARGSKSIDWVRENLIFTEYQYGDHIPGTCYRRRKDGDIVKKWGFFYLRIMLFDSYIQQRSETSSDSALVWAIETRVELETMTCDSEDLSAFYHFLYVVEKLLGDIYEFKAQHKKALQHRHKAIVAAKHEGSGYSTSLFNALNSMATLHVGTALKTGEGISFAEEAYNIAVEKFGPEHYIVQKATTTLIAVHLDKGSIAEAGDFARINYELLTQTGANTCRGQVALAKMQLAKAWLLAPPDQQMEGLEAAERDACSAFEISCSHPKSTYFALCSIVLADVM